MNVSAVNANDTNARKNLFIKYANQFMSFKSNSEENSESSINPAIIDKKTDKIKGIETLTIFPKQVIDGKIVITA